MTRDDVFKLANEAGFNWPEAQTTTIEQRLERFAALVAQQERDACANVCDKYAMARDHAWVPYVRSRECQQAAAAIRSRGNK